MPNRHPTEHLLSLFDYEHLPLSLQLVPSAPPLSNSPESFLRQPPADK